MSFIIEKIEMMMIKKIYFYLWITRVTVLVPIFFAGLCSIHMHNVDVNSLDMILILFAIVLLAGSGFVLNDIRDINKDKISHPSRPLPSNQISLREAHYIFFIMLFISFVLVLSVHDLNLIVLYTITLILLLSYSSVINYAAWIGNIITAVLSIIPWIIPSIYFSNFNIIFIPALTTFLLVFSREILLDVKDINGDKFYSLSTLPILFGEKIASLIASAILTLIFIITFFYGIQMNFNTLFFIMLTLGFLFPSIFIIWAYLINKQQRSLQIAAHLGKIQFILGTIMWWFVSPF